MPTAKGNGYTKVSVRMLFRHVAYLDRIAVDMRLRQGIALSRSQIIRAFIDVAETKDSAKARALSKKANR
jgi:hypothetical protein